MQRTWIFLSIAFVAIGVAFLLNLMPLTNEASKARLTPGDIEGMAMMYEGKLYTLNFQQQERMIQIINQAIEIGKDFQKNPDLPAFDKLVIYRFQKPQIILQPIAYSGKQLVFTLSQLHEGYLQEVSGGELQKMIPKIIDFSD